MTIRTIGIILGAALLTAALGPSAAAGTVRDCVMSQPERDWLDNSLRAWRYMADERLRLPSAEAPSIVVFDSRCRFEARATDNPRWKGEPHDGSVLIPDGNRVPAQVTSFAGNDSRSDSPFFVMALPSVWKTARIPMAEHADGLTAVFLHEFSHVRQVEPLKSIFAAAEAQHSMEDISDDSLQERFKDDPAYVAVIEKEIALLLDAAAEPDSAKARKLAADALALMDSRQKRWFAGEDAYWKNFDDLFLTMEGFGQWVAYAWLSDPAGGRLGRDAARDRMMGTRWWSQNQGLALFLVIDRFVPDWPERAFAEEPALGIDLLRIAASGPTKDSPAV